MRDVFIDTGDTMRKIQFLFLFFLLLLCFTACQTNRNYSVQTVYTQEIAVQYKVSVFGNDGSVLYETVLDIEPEFAELEDGILQMRTGAGNVTQYIFFDVVNNKVSPIYENPELIQFGKIVYMTFYEQKVQLVIRDIFDTSMYFRAYDRNFSKTGVLADALIAAEFLDENTLQVYYLSGEKFEEVQELLMLNAK